MTTLGRCLPAILGFALCVGPAPVRAQSLAAVCRPLEQPTPGGWARYRLRGPDDSTEYRLALVDTTTWGGTPHVWQESLIPTPAGSAVIQSLVPAAPYDPTTVRRAVVRAPGQPAMELPPAALQAMRERAQGTAGLDACRTGQALGWETLEVPAGRVRALRVRYTREGRTALVWLAPGIPFAMIRSIVTGGAGAADSVELVLVGHGRDATPSMPLPRP